MGAEQRESWKGGRYVWGHAGVPCGVLHRVLAGSPGSKLSFALVQVDNSGCVGAPLDPALMAMA